MEGAMSNIKDGVSTIAGDPEWTWGSAWEWAATCNTILNKKCVYEFLKENYPWKKIEINLFFPTTQTKISSWLRHTIKASNVYF
jgi:hypothetical protein